VKKSVPALPSFAGEPPRRGTGPSLSESAAEVGYGSGDDDGPFLFLPHGDDDDAEELR
jgi:hypothetical protein